jgi:hypothetical protein
VTLFSTATATAARKGPVPSVVPFKQAISRAWKSRRRLLAASLAHHPEGPEYDQDCYRLRGWRFCVGCFTTIPVFFATVTLLVSMPALGGPVAWTLLGVGLVLMQGVSSAGWARWRALKAVVKACLGAGLGLLLMAVLASGLAQWLQVLVLLSLLLLVSLSAVPRSLRMRKAQEEG